MPEMLKYSDKLDGVWTAMVTPFRRGSINLEVVGRLVDNAVKAGIRGIIVLGTTGESPTVTDSERSLVISKALATSNGRIPIFVGVGSNNLHHAMAQVNQANSLGADGLLVVTPYYSKPTQAGLKDYFLKIAFSTDLPIILYHIPGRCAVGISPELVLELSRHPNIIGLKDAGGDVARVSDLVRSAPDGFQVLSGDDALTLPMLSVGAVGVVSVLSNLVPEMAVEMVGLASRNRFQEARQIHHRLNSLCNALFLETSPSPIKEALQMVGVPVGKVRLPLVPVTAKTRSAIRMALKDLELVA